jgi:hypothetical protein
MTGVARPSKIERRSAMNASTPKPSQYNATVRPNMLSEPGASGSINRHSMPMAGDCQSPKRHALASS